MGRVIVEQIVTADGDAADAADAADADGEMSFMTPETATKDAVDGADADQLALLDQVDAIVLGASTYRMFADYWPTVSASDDPVAGPINTLPKHVISSTLDSAPWGEGSAHVESGDAVEIVDRLASHYDKDLIVWGSLSITDALLTAGAVDVLRLRIVPTLIGTGRSFAPATLADLPLTLTHHEAYPGGLVTLQYDIGTPPADAGL